MKLSRFIFFPLAFVYWVITSMRNGFYHLEIFRASKFSLPVICVGNLSMGGTGKTPHTEYLIRLLKNEYNLATLSRGFGRKERGFILADPLTTNARQIGDEPLQYVKKYGDEIQVAVDANRVTGIMDICRLKPETEVILLDDAFQHRAVKPGLSILITAYSAPFYSDFIVPVGNLRESRQGKKRADIIIVSKCPVLTGTEKDKIIQRINPLPKQEIFFSSIKYGKQVRLIDQESKPLKEGSSIILVTGIANANPLVNYLAKNYKILHHFNYNDHHNFKLSELDEIHNLFDKFASENPVIITTEKDAMRLLLPDFLPKIKAFDWRYQSIEVKIDQEKAFNKRIKQYVEQHS